MTSCSGRGELLGDVQLWADKHAKYVVEGASRAEALGHSLASDLEWHRVRLYELTGGVRSRLEAMEEQLAMSTAAGK